MRFAGSVLLAQGQGESGGPSVTSKVVTRASLAEALPAGMRPVDAEDRKSQIEKRAEGFARRFEDWFP